MSFSFKPTQPAGDPGASTPAAQAAPISLGGLPPSARVNEEGKTGIIQIILYVIFGLAVLIAIGLFGYQRYLLSRIDAQKAILDQEDKALGALNLKDMRDLSNRMKVVNQVLAEHTSVTSAFLILENSIENPVTYTKFGLTRKDNKGYDLQVGAVAPSYKAVAQQLDTLKSDTYSKDFIPTVSYDGLSLDSSGQVNFNLSMSILIQGKLPETILTTAVSQSLNQTQASTTVATSSTTPQ